MHIVELSTAVTRTQRVSQVSFRDCACLLQTAVECETLSEDVVSQYFCTLLRLRSLDVCNALNRYHSISSCVFLQYVSMHCLKL